MKTVQVEQPAFKKDNVINVDAVTNWQRLLLLLNNILKGKAAEEEMTSSKRLVINVTNKILN